MLLPTIENLPAPETHQKGWPWTEATPPATQYPGSGETWPKISIVTPSFNQADYLEETIRSVLLQGYPNLEYTIMDGGSSDGSVEIIKKYEFWLSSWTSKIDKGQADAIRTGFHNSSGTLLGWLNSDDIFLPNALIHIANKHLENPQAIILGKVQNFTNGGERKILNEIPQQGLTLRSLILPGKSNYAWHQPGVFFPHQAYHLVGGLDPTLQYGMDHDLMCRFLIANILMINIDQTVAGFRVHDTSKTSAKNIDLAVENYRIRMRYWDNIPEKHWYLVLKMKIHFILKSLKLIFNGKFKDALITLEYGLWKPIKENQ